MDEVTLQTWLDYQDVFSRSMAKVIVEHGLSDKFVGMVMKERQGRMNPVIPEQILRFLSNPKLL